MKEDKEKKKKKKRERERERKKQDLFFYVTPLELEERVEKLTPNRPISHFGFYFYR